MRGKALRTVSIIEVDKQSGSGVVDSSCRQVCLINSRSGFFEECGRTLAEIDEWTSAPQARKHEFLDQLSNRCARG